MNNTHSVDLASIATSKLLDVIFNDRGEGRLVADVVHPVRELRVPDKGMATDELAVAGGPVDESVRPAEAE